MEIFILLLFDLFHYSPYENSICKYESIIESLYFTTNELEKKYIVKIRIILKPIFNQFVCQLILRLSTEENEQQRIYLQL